MLRLNPSKSTGLILLQTTDLMTPHSPQLYAMRLWIMPIRPMLLRDMQIRIVDGLIFNAVSSRTRCKMPHFIYSIQNQNNNPIHLTIYQRQWRIWLLLFIYALNNSTLSLPQVYKYIQIGSVNGLPMLWRSSSAAAATVKTQTPAAFIGQRTQQTWHWHTGMLTAE